VARIVFDAPMAVHREIFSLQSEGECMPLAKKRAKKEKPAKAISFAAEWYMKRWNQYAEGLRKIG
jgi:hypothetical protein